MKIDSNRFEIKQLIDKENVALLLTAAFNGGIKSWAKDLKITTDAPNYDVEWGEPFNNNGPSIMVACPILGGAIMFTDDEEVPNKNYVINRWDLNVGLDRMARKYPRHFADVMTDNIDTTTADIFIQCCVFGEIKYQ